MAQNFPETFCDQDVKHSKKSKGVNQICLLKSMI